ncbi:toll/interleukin-1 receptor domain-containing protein [Rhizobium sp. CC1099]|uniref:toll/interleukin-1 receptor domain-containing protein n=1 Tax=Rhizobium sp. CC1099 TaxID=3039160 RepID=UPI0024B08377|nr:toll/interleukin-1 receptor domain-containing protein [Rhizobium sp. CC1099]WFU89009.1 toll/interleukin-1 receptor domain-containing protein [Rhizobium sp. CC1099]
MPHRIFLSHKHEDKPVVEPVALKLRDIFGEEAIFYDSWSIKPGDGIIEKMNEGLSAPEFVFFFVSKLALESGLVKIEWQNALLRATKGETRLIPVRLGNVVLPEVLRQNLYIDLYSVGLDVAIHQIVNVVQGNSSFTPQHQDFSNLTWSIKDGAENEIALQIEASHYMEPNPNFILLVANAQDEVQIEVNNGQPMLTKFYEKPFPGVDANGITFAPMGGAITPERPLQLKVKKIKTADVGIKGIVHGWSEPFRDVPPSPSMQRLISNAKL